MLQELKDRLRITWPDEDTHLSNLIDGSKAYLEGRTGTPLDFEKDLIVRDLALERCRYVYNNAADEFPKNFAEDILALQIRSAVKARREANEAANTSGNI